MFFSQILDPSNLRTFLGANSSDKLISFYRGMIDSEFDLLDDDYLTLRVFPKYIEFESTFNVIFSLEILNKNEEELFLLLPKTSTQSKMNLKDEKLFKGVTRIEPGESEEFELEAEVTKEDLLKFGPINFSFFACFEEELGEVFSEKQIEVNVWKKKVILPVNILRFMNSLEDPDLAIVNEMKLCEEVVVNNQGLLLTDISAMFPNLCKTVTLWLIDKLSLGLKNWTCSFKRNVPRKMFRWKRFWMGQSRLMISKS
jgi:hypothetical protein